MLSCLVSAKLLLGLESELTLVTGKKICWMLRGDICLQGSCIREFVTAKFAIVGGGRSWLAAMMTLHVII